jgi:hypothetical protein
MVNFDLNRLPPDIETLDLNFSPPQVTPVNDLASSSTVSETNQEGFF